MDKRAVFDGIGADRERFAEVAKSIWESPELGLHEERSSKALIDLLESEGFEIETGVGGMPTAFVAEYGSGGPVIGLLGEYDALPGLSQSASTEPDPIDPGGPGHGCGHNLYGTACAFAAIGVARAIDDGLSGTIRFYGCPAEETLVGKVFMARAGAFDDCDAAITWHPSDRNRPQLGSSLALDSISFTYTGTAAHAGGSPESGRSALDGVELLNAGVERMREHVPEKTRVHYAITDGGGAPNVVPAEASVWYFVRAPDRDEVDRITEWVTDIADAAAQMTHTSVERRYITGCYDFLPNETITETLWENMQAVGGIEFTEEQEAFAREIQETVDPDRIEATLEKLPEETRAEMEGEAVYGEPIEAYDAGEVSGGSTDVGDVSYVVPTAQLRAATWPIGTPGHSWQAVAANHEFGIEGALYAAKVQAGAAIDLLSDHDLVERAQAEFEEERDAEYETPLPEEVEPPFDVTAP